MTKIQNLLKTNLGKKISEWTKLLLKGELGKVEEELQKELQDIHGCIMSTLLTEVGTSSEFKEVLLTKYECCGVGQLRQRENRIQLYTGDWVYYKSYYARQVSVTTSLPSRHLSEVYWGCVKGASIGYAQLVSVYSVMCPSFEVGAKILGLHGIKTNGSRMREMSIKLGEIGHQVGIKGQLEEGESLKDKRVVISIDGGRSRTRHATGKYNRKGNACYQTPWKEPKILVVEVLNEEGELERKQSLPFYYGTLRSMKDLMNKLKEVLVLLNANQASIIQFIADGALAIWGNIRSVIRSIGIGFSKVVFTLDYYHAVEHLKALSLMLPYEEKQQKVVFNNWKEMLWEGFANSIARDFKKRIKKADLSLSEKMKTAIYYFINHHDHMQYKKFKRRKLLCGSGLVESAVRRIINLRFKGPSTFWKKRNLENLILLRCAFLAGRWHNLLKNIQLSLKNLGTI